MERSGEKIESAAKSKGVTPPSSPSWQNSDVGAFLQLVSIAVAGSLIVGFYVYLIGTLNRTKSNIDATAQSALYAAKELSAIYVDSSSFGKVGLCDKDLPEFSGLGYGYNNDHITGIDSIYKTLSIDQSVAQNLNRPLMKSLINKDLESAKKLEAELTERLFEAAEPDLLAGGNGSQTAPINTNTASNIYRNVYRMLSLDRASKENSLIEVRIKLGRLKESEGTALSAPKQTGNRIVDNSLFVPSDQKHAPNLVLIEGIFQSKQGDNSQTIRTITSSRCALISAAPVQPAASTLLLFFPDGKPNMFNSVISILQEPKWSRQGYWQQAVGSEVPGRGSLAPSLQPVLPEMSPADALSIALYHWLRQLGPNVDENKLLALLRQEWSPSGLPQDSERHAGANNEPNSCLAIDTGAREYAILNQTAPGGSGQTALCQAFNIPMAGVIQTTGASRFPPSAIPLFVDQNGQCNLAGRRGFDKQLVLDFQNSVYETNLAAVESLAVSKLVIARLNSELTQLDQKIFIERQELASVINRLERLRREAANLSADTTDDGKTEAARKIELAANMVESLKATIVEDEEERKASRHTNQLAIVALTNATRVASETYELCAHSFKLCKEGIWRIDKPNAGYLISRRYCFQPFAKAISASDFLGNPDEVTEARNYWFGRKVQVLQDLTAKDAHADLTIDGLPWNQFISQPPLQTTTTAVAIFLTSTGLAADDKIQPKYLALSNYPFENMRLPSGQLLYYCQDALSTGAVDGPPVSWSVLLRDFVASRSQTSKGRETGVAVPSQHADWCKQDAGNNVLCPGLAAEFQLRTPLPKLGQSAEGSYLTNPTNNAQIPQIPPVPSDLL